MLPEELRESATSYAIHPALLDAALHTMAVSTASTIGTHSSHGRGHDEVQLPFEWTQVRLHATGPSELRVRIELDGNRARLLVADSAGQAVASIGGLQLRAATREQVQAALLVSSRVDQEDHRLYRVDWQPAPAASTIPDEPVETSMSEGSQGGSDVVLGGDGEIGAADGATGDAEPVECLRGGDLVYEVEVDVEEVGAAVDPRGHDVSVPDFLAQGSRVGHMAAIACRLLISHYVGYRF